MASLRDKVEKIGHEYIWGKHGLDKEPSKKVDGIGADQGSTFEEEVRKAAMSAPGLNPELRRKIAMTAPMFWKGISKKGLDSFRYWFNFVPIGSKDSMSESDKNIIRDFDKRNVIKRKFFIAYVCACIYGDGYITIRYLKDNKIQVKDSPVKNAEPRILDLIDPENITEIKYLNKYFKSKGIKHFHYVNRKTGRDIWIHPDRMIHVKLDELPFNQFGISKIDLLRKILKSKLNMDIATGEIMTWFSHGILDMTIEGMTPAQELKMEEDYKKHLNYYYHDEHYKLDVKNPTAIDPKEFYNWVVMNIAASLIMPTHILTGVQTGKVTGSEIGVSDYYRDVQDAQELIFTPILEELYRKLLASRGKTFNYDIIWNPIFLDELSEARILESRVRSASLAKQAGLIDNEEGRRMINKGQIELETKKKIKQDKPKSPSPENPASPPQPLTKPVKNIQPSKKEQTKIKATYRALTEEEKEMIKARQEQIKHLAELEHKLGEKILKEQDELFDKDGDTKDNGNGKAKSTRKKDNR